MRTPTHSMPEEVEEGIFSLQEHLAHQQRRLRSKLFEHELQHTLYNLIHQRGKVPTENNSVHGEGSLETRKQQKSQDSHCVLDRTPLPLANAMHVEE